MFWPFYDMWAYRPGITENILKHTFAYISIRWMCLYCCCLLVHVIISSVIGEAVFSSVEVKSFGQDPQLWNCFPVSSLKIQRLGKGHIVISIKAWEWFYVRLSKCWQMCLTSWICFNFFWKILKNKELLFYKKQENYIRSRLFWWLCVQHNDNEHFPFKFSLFSKKHGKQMSCMVQVLGVFSFYSMYVLSNYLFVLG